MQRLIVAPQEWGSRSGYPWLENTGAVIPHHDYTTVYTDGVSIRVWEPGRMKFSSPGTLGDVDGADQIWTAPELPTAVEIHGIKGTVDICLDPFSRWTWVNPVDGVPLNIQPTFEQQVDALGGLSQNRGHGALPVFVSLYRGTLKAIDDQAGWEIDSGPPDDAEVILDLDITNPATVESSRLDWWDMEWIQYPAAARQPYASSSNPVGAAIDREERGELIQSSLGGGWLHYKCNLTRNIKVRPDQVVWLDFRFGLIVVLIEVGFGENVELVPATPTLIRFSMSHHMSMMATPRVQL